jgi:hypothetical protein
MTCNGQKAGSSTSDPSHNKFSKMPPPTSMHLWTRCRVLHVARSSSWRRSFIRTQAMLMRATRSARYPLWCAKTPPTGIPINRNPRGLRFLLNHHNLGNRSKLDPCSYELFCLESHILSFPKVLQILPESPCICIRHLFWNFLFCDYHNVVAAALLQINHNIITDLINAFLHKISKYSTAYY